MSSLIAESFMGKPMPASVIGILVIGTGAAIVIGAWLDAKWMMQIRQLRGVFWLAGEKHARTTAAIIGGLVIIGGILISLGFRIRQPPAPTSQKSSPGLKSLEISGKQ